MNSEFYRIKRHLTLLFLAFLPLLLFSCKKPILVKVYSLNDYIAYNQKKPVAGVTIKLNDAKNSSFVTNATGQITLSAELTEDQNKGKQNLEVVFYHPQYVDNQRSLYAKTRFLFNKVSLKKFESLPMEVYVWDPPLALTEVKASTISSITQEILDSVSVRLEYVGLRIPQGNGFISANALKNSPWEIGRFDDEYISSDAGSNNLDIQFDFFISDTTYQIGRYQAHPDSIAPGRHAWLPAGLYRFEAERNQYYTSKDTFYLDPGRVNEITIGLKPKFFVCPKCHNRLNRRDILLNDGCPICGYSLPEYLFKCPVCKKPSFIDDCAGKCCYIELGLCRSLSCPVDKKVYSMEKITETRGNCPDHPQEMLADMIMCQTCGKSYLDFEYNPNPASLKQDFCPNAFCASNRYICPKCGTKAAGNQLIATRGLCPKCQFRIIKKTRCDKCGLDVELQKINGNQCPKCGNPLY